MRAVIDADSMVYAAGFIADKDSGPVSHAIHALDMMVRNVLSKTGATEHAVYLTGASGAASRILAYPDYKANRDSTRKPTHYLAMREHLVISWGAEILEIMEADDMVSVEACLDPSNSIICSIDKDLDTTPGWHYHWRRDDLYCLSDIEASYNFYTQVLVGDVADNVKGLKGVGPVKASKTLEGVGDELGMFDATYEAYEKHGYTASEHLTVCEVLWMARELDSFGNPVPFSPPALGH